ncbi:LPS export ABC transporter periplasmic protein LptC [Halomonas sp. HP20-15]|uniref:LPS export ABC transporter periplasmic protein LptC n=1 Tax=Halomonas sp. HP20-15 TaxID=3085901 RepID=UPI002981F0A5|nr:LPS export ABC transporter periplasmic protein LptC [Halomonas sp. HP20-15]MDW5378631.1 LPS export ABC transporter periplasmic protein LptC [Halomonas sp. HP20-15]
MLQRLSRLSYKWWLALILIALGGLLALIEQRNISLPAPPSTAASGEPDYYLEDATLTRFDAAGTAHQRLETPRLTHTPDDDVTHLETPDARLVDDRGRVWFASADTGRLGANANPLKLSGDAQLEAPEQGWQINSEVLVYDADTGHAWSESEAVLRKFQQRVRGDRFDAWLDSGRMRLNGNVRGHHPPIDEDSGS